MQHIPLGTPERENKGWKTRRSSSLYILKTLILQSLGELGF